MPVAATYDRAMRRTAPLAVTVAALAVAAPMAQASGSAPSAGSAAAAGPAITGTPCALGRGVTEVVDLGGAGRDEIRLRCTPFAQKSGMSALTGTGYSVTSVQRQPGAVCQISGLPSSGQAGCWQLSSHWAYWRAGTTSSWAYSSTGAGSTGTVAVNFVEGWAFGADAKPRISPYSVKKRRPVTKDTLTVRSSRSTVRAGTSVTISASGVDPRAYTTLTLGTIRRAATSDSAGRVSWTVTVPSTWSAAKRTVTVMDRPGAERGRVTITTTR